MHEGTVTLGSGEDLSLITLTDVLCSRGRACGYSPAGTPGAGVSLYVTHHPTVSFIKIIYHRQIKLYFTLLH